MNKPPASAALGVPGSPKRKPVSTAPFCFALPLPAASLPIASLLLGLATAEAIQKSTQLACDLRWPNDVLVNERKVAGILTQLVESCIVAGIGINVNQTSFPTDLRTPATSFRIAERWTAQSREEVIVRSA